MKISVIITLKKDVLDPQGKVIHQTLDGMGFNDINEVRQGKYFEIDTKENDPKKAKDNVEAMCKKLLSNLVIENEKSLLLDGYSDTGSYLLKFMGFVSRPSFNRSSSGILSTSTSV